MSGGNASATALSRTGTGSPLVRNGSPRARNPNELLRSASLRLDKPPVSPRDAPSRVNWIAPSMRPAEFQTMDFVDAKYGVSLAVLFEDPTDDGFLHEVRVWSLNPASHLFAFAGDYAEDRYHLLCDGTIVLDANLSFAVVTKGVQGCLFSFARKS